MHIHMYEYIENERDKKESQLGVHLIDELNGYLDWIFLNFFFLVLQALLAV